MTTSAHRPDMRTVQVGAYARPDLGMVIDTSAPITLKALGDHLWESEKLFRNKISNQKDYVLALLFFKRACDRYAEETASAIEELGDVPEATSIIEAHPTAYHAILIPEGSFWEDVSNTDEADLGKAMNDALSAIGRANPAQLSGVFESIDFNDKRALPGDDLSRLIDHFEALGPLTNERVPADLLGRAYEWTIAKFAANAGRRGGEFYTPGPVAELGARLLAPQPGEEIYDPTCGSGGLLLKVLAEAERLHGAKATRTVALFGQELNPETWAIARMNMLLHGAGGQATILQGDTLANPQFRAGAGIRRFLAVIANPPFSSTNWGHERLKAQGDPFGRIKHLPKKRHGEMAFVQHMVASLDEHGRMAVVVPNGVLFRTGAEQLVRRDLVERDLVEAVIQLPKDMFYGAGIPACWLVINKAKRPSRKERVLFIEASDLFERVETKNVLADEHITRIVNTFSSDEESEGFATFTSTAEIAKRRYSLNVRQYARGDEPTEDDVLSLDDALAAFELARAARAAAEQNLDLVLGDVEAASE